MEYNETIVECLRLFARRGRKIRETLSFPGDETVEKLPENIEDDPDERENPEATATT